MMPIFRAYYGTMEGATEKLLQKVAVKESKMRLSCMMFMVYTINIVELILL